MGIFTMQSLSAEYAPYFQDGALFLTEKAIDLLIKAGVKREIIDATRNGLALENGASIAEISTAMEQILAQLAEKNAAAN